jgi:thiol-disulfide isomerase/thioredoxin
MLERLLIVLAVVAVAAAVGLWWQARDGRVREGGDGRFSPDQLGRVGLDAISRSGAALLLGSPTCAPCVTVRGILGEVADERRDFRWTYVDAADHMDIADAHRVMRVPTLFVLDSRGRILARTSGVPAKRDLLAVLDREASSLDPAA